MISPSWVSWNGPKTKGGPFRVLVWVNCGVLHFMKPRTGHLAANSLIFSGWDRRTSRVKSYQELWEAVGMVPVHFWNEKDSSCKPCIRHLAATTSRPFGHHSFLPLSNHIHIYIHIHNCIYILYIKQKKTLIENIGTNQNNIYRNHLQLRVTKISYWYVFIKLS